MTIAPATMRNREEITISQASNDPAELSRIVEEFCARLFPDLPVGYVRDRLPFVAGPELFLATCKERHVGFKLGYRSSREQYVSWLGGVDLDFRRKGIASELAAAQQSCAERHGIKSIETRTRIANSPMISLNLRNGFSVSGLEADAFGRLVLVMRKSLV